MTDFFDTVVQETKEVDFAEKDAFPSFFEDMPEVTEQTDSPVSELDQTTSADHVTLITRNESLEGDQHPITGIPFEKQVLTLPNGEVIEGVFPTFESVFDGQIPENLYQESDHQQFKECNEQLYEAIQADPNLEKTFTKEQIEQIKEGITDGTAPDGYVWHHDATPGKIQLVEFEVHATTGHTGGRTVWGGGNDNR